MAGPYPEVDALMASLVEMELPQPHTSKRKDPPGLCHPCLPPSPPPHCSDLGVATEEGAGVDIFRARQMQRSRHAAQGGGTLSSTFSGSSQ